MNSARDRCDTSACQPIPAGVPEAGRRGVTSPRTAVNRAKVLVLPRCRRGWSDHRTTAEATQPPPLTPEPPKVCIDTSTSSTPHPRLPPHLQHSPPRHSPTNGSPPPAPPHPRIPPPWLPDLRHPHPRLPPTSDTPPGIPPPRLPPPPIPPPTAPPTSDTPPTHSSPYLEHPPSLTPSLSSSRDISPHWPRPEPWAHLLIVTPASRPGRTGRPRPCEKSHAPSLSVRPVCAVWPTFTFLCDLQMWNSGRLQLSPGLVTNWICSLF